MKAIVNTRYGPPEVVELKEVGKPVPKDDEVLIRIHAATVNRTDCGFRSAEYFITRLFSGLVRPRNPTLGNEFAGVIEATGKDVILFSVGDQVFGYDDRKFGAHAGYKTIAENDAITTMPADLTYSEAAAMCEGAHYALCDIRAAKVKSGQNVLVYGATGAIGSAAVQLLKYFGARVTAVCDTGNAGLVRSLGADEVIDYTSEDFTKTAHKFDFIFDAVGKSSFSQCRNLLKLRGIYISTELGKNYDNIVRALIAPFSAGKKVLFPIPSISKEDVVFLKELVVAGKYKPVIDRTYKPEEIVEAYRYVESGRKTGNVILVMD